LQAPSGLSGSISQSESVALTHQLATAQILGSSSGKPPLDQYFRSDRRRIAADLDAMHIVPDPRAMEWIRKIAAMP
jgi:hypothetical protein